MTILDEVENFLRGACASHEVLEREVALRNFMLEFEYARNRKKETE